MPFSHESSFPLPSTSSSISPAAVKHTGADANANAGNYLNGGGQSFLQRPRLTRQRKLRYLSDYEVGLHVSDDSSLSASPQASLNSHSPGGSEHRSTSAVPQPLPLPESPLTRQPESTGPNAGHVQLGSPSVEHLSLAFGR